MDNKWDTDKFEARDEARVTKEVYTPPSTLKLPKAIQERFHSNGYATRWVRFRKEDIRRRMHPSEGFTFVNPTELEPSELLMLGSVEQAFGSDIITNGDLVLMKTRVEKAQARREYFENKTKAQAKAIEDRLRENEIESRGSRSVVRTGKHAHFAGN